MILERFDYKATGSATPRPAERDASGNWIAPNVPMFPMSNGLVRIQFRVEQECQAPSFQLSEFSVNKVVTPIGNNLNGRITNLPAGGADGPSAILTYDCENNLSCVSNTVSGFTAFYWYDPAGRRIAKSENNLLTLYIWDGMEIVATANADGTIREYFTRGIGIAGDVGSLVAETRFSGDTSSTVHLHSNWRGDVVMATDAAGNVVGEYSYTTFGEQLSAVGTYAPRFTFFSKERDVSGLVYYGFRYYSPMLCRWISEDPIGEAGGINLYQFCGNNPINRADLSGENPLILGLGALFVFGVEWANAPAPGDPVYPDGEGFANMTAALAVNAVGNVGLQTVRNALPKQVSSSACNPFQGKTSQQLDSMFSALQANNGNKKQVV